MEYFATFLCVCVCVCVCVSWRRATLASICAHQAQLKNIADADAALTLRVKELLSGAPAGGDVAYSLPPACTAVDALASDGTVIADGDLTVEVVSAIVRAEEAARNLQQEQHDAIANGADAPTVKFAAAEGVLGHNCARIVVQPASEDEQYTPDRGRTIALFVHGGVLTPGGKKPLSEDLPERIITWLQVRHL